MHRKPWKHGGKSTQWHTRYLLRGKEGFSRQRRNRLGDRTICSLWAEVGRGMTCFIPIMMKSSAEPRVGCTMMGQEVKNFQKEACSEKEPLKVMSEDRRWQPENIMQKTLISKGSWVMTSSGEGWRQQERGMSAPQGELSLQLLDIDAMEECRPNICRSFDLPRQARDLNPQFLNIRS